MKCLVIPDVHGTHHWKIIKEKISNYDFIVFHGDFFDNWKNKWPDQMRNFCQILSLKRDNPEKIKLLLGNHCISYILDERCSGYQWDHAFDIEEIFRINKHLFDIVFILNNYIFSHAGVSQWWLNRTGIKSVHEINQLFLERPNYFRFVGPESSGNNEFEGPLWIRPKALQQVAVEGFNQVIGHSECHSPPQTLETYNGDKIIIIDSPKHNYLHEMVI